MANEPGNAEGRRLVTLYVCYFGIAEPLVQTQVLPYLRDLAVAGYAVHLMTFETISLSAEGREQRRAKLRSEGIAWTSLRYHKWPTLPATLFDILVGAASIARLAVRQDVQVLHARAHVPLVMSLLARPATSARIIFDLRGLMAEEYVEAGLWREDSPIVRLVKRCERMGLRLADQVIVLTERLRERLVSQRLVAPEKLEVIPCCTDLALYPPIRASIDQSATDSSQLQLVYAGSTVGLYQLDEMARFFLAIHMAKPRSIFHVLTSGADPTVIQRLRDVGVPDTAFSVHSVPAQEVPEHLARSHVGISFRMSTASQIAASPTKIAEYLAAGLPVVSNRGIGDMDAILTGDRVGILVENYSQESFVAAVASLDRLLQEPSLRLRCQETARKRFGLREVGAPRYRRVYERLESLVNRPRKTTPGSAGNV